MIRLYAKLVLLRKVLLFTHISRKVRVFRSLFFRRFPWFQKIEICGTVSLKGNTTRKGKIRFTPATMTKLQPAFFFEPKETRTGEETALDLLLNGISLSTDIENHINGFLEEEPEHPYICGEELASYIVCHDDLNNEYAFPIEPDEKDYFEHEIED